MQPEEWGTRILATRMETLSDYESIKEQFADKFLYRGQEQAHWTFKTSYQRLIEERIKLGLPTPKEIDMIKTFQSIRRFSNRNHNLWDTIAKMQHYGVKTRMMDFTDDLDVALFFALTHKSFQDEQGIKMENSKSYVLGIAKELIHKEAPPVISIDELEEWSKPREADLSYALFEYRMRVPSPRIRQQRGVLLFSHNPLWPMAEKLSIMNNWAVIAEIGALSDLSEDIGTNSKLRLIEIAVNREEFRRIREYLTSFGIDPVRLFPGSEGKIKLANEL